MMRTVARGPVTLVWQNQRGGLTGRVEVPEPLFLKWNPAGSPENLAAEAERMYWLQGRHPAPDVVDLVSAGDGDLLVTRALPGLSAVDEYWRARPRQAIRALARGLRTLHELPVDECPFSWDVSSRVASAERSVPDRLRTPPPIDRAVVCQGDPCAPNTLLDAAGDFLAHVDVGRLGVADRWADLAVITMSLGWNYADPDEELFWEAYGVSPDTERIDYYRALSEAT